MTCRYCVYKGRITLRFYHNWNFEMLKTTLTTLQSLKQKCTVSSFVQHSDKLSWSVVTPRFSLCRRTISSCSLRDVWHNLFLLISSLLDSYERLQAAMSSTLHDEFFGHSFLKAIFCKVFFPTGVWVYHTSSSEVIFPLGVKYRALPGFSFGYLHWYFLHMRTMHLFGFLGAYCAKTTKGNQLIYHPFFIKSLKIIASARKVIHQWINVFHIPWDQCTKTWMQLLSN